MDSRFRGNDGKRIGLKRRFFTRSLVLVTSLSAILVWGSLPDRPVFASPNDAPPEETEQRGEHSFEIRFEGNRALSERALRKAAVNELADFERLGCRRADADDAAFQMELAGKKAGHAFAVVDYRYEVLPETIRVTFVVDEGPRVCVSDLAFQGNTVVGDDELSSFMRSARTGLFGGGEMVFYEPQIRAAISRMRDLYLTKGYLDVEIEEPQLRFSEDRREVRVLVTIREGIGYRIVSVRTQGDVLDAAVEALDRASRELVGMPFFPRRKLTLRSRIAEIYGNLGYPDLRAEIVEHEGELPGDIVLEAGITSGPKVKISDISVSGNERTRESFIRSRATLLPGDDFDLTKKRESFQELYRTGLFSKVDITLGPGGDSDERRLEIVVEETPSKELSIEAGWGSYEMLRGMVGLKEKNLLGTGRILRTELAGSIRSQGLLVGLTDPWLFNSRITADLPVSYLRREEPSFTRVEIGLSLLFSRELTENTTATAGAFYRFTTLQDVEVDAEIYDFEDEYNLAGVKIQATYDTRDDIFFPTSGFRSFLSLEEADAVFGSEESFLRVTAGTRWFIALSGSTVLGLRYGTGFLVPLYEEVTVPLAERFYNGGESMVRGFREHALGPTDEAGDPLGGYAFNLASAELRQRVYGNFAATLFADCGNVSPTRSRPENIEDSFGNRDEAISATFDDYFYDLRPAVGIGLQYLLPVGPARLDVAFNPWRRIEHTKIKGDDDGYVIKEDLYVVHFSVGMAF